MNITTATTVDRARTAAQTILEGLADPDRVRFLTGKPSLRTLPASVGGGAAGVALAHIEAARTGDGAWDTARTWITRALSAPVNGSGTATLWSGAPALGLVTAVAATSPAHLIRARTRLDEVTTRLTQHRLDQAYTRIDRGERPPLAEFDLIQGITGLAVYHLHTHPDATITRQVLAYLVRLTLPLTDDPDQLPGWWTEQSPHSRLEPAFPGGHLNLGVAHGISAPLAVLSLALMRGIAVSGHTDAIGSSSPLRGVATPCRGGRPGRPGTSSSPLRGVATCGPGSGRGLRRVLIAPARGSNVGVGVFCVSVTSPHRPCEG